MSYPWCKNIMLMVLYICIICNWISDSLISHLICVILYAEKLFHLSYDYISSRIVLMVRSWLFSEHVVLHFAIWSDNSRFHTDLLCIWNPNMWNPDYRFHRLHGLANSNPYFHLSQYFTKHHQFQSWNQSFLCYFYHQTLVIQSQLGGVNILGIYNIYNNVQS
jgi:hypothetical protein